MGVLLQVEVLLQRKVFGDLVPVAGRRYAVAGDIRPEVGEVVIVLYLGAARQGVTLGVAEDLDLVEIRRVLGAAHGRRRGRQELRGAGHGPGRDLSPLRRQSRQETGRLALE